MTLLRPTSRVLALLLLVLLAACASELPETSPLLARFDDPPELAREPDDEADRLRLPIGTFSGLEVERARDAVDELLGETGGGLNVRRVVENSPGAAAGIDVGDVLMFARVQGGDEVELRFPSQWRELELESKPGTRVDLVYDRAAGEFVTTLVLAPRIEPPPRETAKRVREQIKVGVALRAGTEVEARAAGLGPGAGAVIVGLAMSSPWRAVGLRYGDFIERVNGEPVADPQMVLQAVLETRPKDRLALVVRRAGRSLEVEAPVSRRKQQVDRVWVPPFYYHRKKGEKKETGVLLSLVFWESTPAAWRVRLFWVFEFGGGDTDELQEIGV